jgi:hypothetical protein
LARVRAFGDARKVISDRSRPRPVTLIESVDDELAARYRAEAALILARMMACAKPVEHPLLGFLREIARQLATALRHAPS